ncbi:MAG: VirB3 family type IV secretion system protein [Hydrogenophaga sp.]|uniref:VirB3 family type IV secretion system protein n=1 Tax=Hydrogenophaga sp. TaxID=1904254 RepID=UPI002631F850|nr:VirB3 family type IV secretion system protein [Hydrogenophaga sp.]MCV0439006.1 VirB3 family type IV secretion system protein [Hydrogenophaga sp.]
MASRSSPFHISLHRPKLIMGVEKGSFAGIVFLAVFALVAKMYWAFPVVGVIYLIARWVTKKDDQFVAILLRYLNEEHVYDATPRASDVNSRPRGWGKGLPR